LVALLAFLALSVPMLGSFVFVEAESRRAYERHVDDVAQGLAARLDEQLQMRLSLVSGLRRELELGTVEPGASFGARAAELQRMAAGYQAINYIDAAGVIRQVVPLEPNRPALDRDLSTHPVAAPVLEQARRTGATAVTPPMELYQGGIGVAAYVPVHGGRQGFVNVVFRLQPLIDQLQGPPFGSDVGVELYDGDRRAYPVASPEGRPAERRRATVPFGDGAFSVGVVPTDELRASFRPTSSPTLLALALGAALAVAGLAFAVQRQRENRAAEVARLGQVERMEALATMAGGIAHDFNNTLALMMGSLELLKEQLEGDEEASAELDQLLSTCDDAAQLTRQLLVLSRHPATSSGSMVPDDELAQSGKLLERLLAKNQALQLDLSAPGVAVRGDGTALRQILVNLLLNAKDAMPDGGTVTLRTRHVAGRLWIEVSDTGVGMSAETRARAFDPFFTTKSVGAGTGLGLSMVFSTVTRLGGSVSVESAPGQGTTFRLWFPLVDAVVGQGDEQAAGPPLRVLVVDDDPGLRDAFARSLERAGLDVAMASSGEQALELVDERLDVLVTDVRMPGIGGAELARRVRRQWPRVAVVFCTGFADESELSVEGKALGVVLEKPFHLRRLHAAVVAQGQQARAGLDERLSTGSHALDPPVPSEG
jgi:signal transduction histidine kinase/ActR/RegA family two-component response regulator